MSAAAPQRSPSKALESYTVEELQELLQPVAVPSYFKGAHLRAIFCEEGKPRKKDGVLHSLYVVLGGELVLAIYDQVLLAQPSLGSQVFSAPVSAFLLNALQHPNQRQPGLSS